MSHYLKVLFLCVVSFIAILMTTRLEDIVNFSSMGPNGWLILKFIIYQIPYILPIAIPISCLISTILLLQRLSSTHELTAFRAAGFSLPTFLAPVLIASVFVALANFTIISELSTASHLSINLLKAELRSINPLQLVRNKHLLKMKGIYFDTLGSSKVGESAEQVVLALPNYDKTRVNLLVAKNLEASTETFRGEGITFISCINGAEEEGFDRLVLENVGSTDSMAGDFMDLLYKQTWKMNNDLLPLPLLLAKLKDDKNAFMDHPTQEKKKEYHRSSTEVYRRISLGISAFTFTLMGAAFGIGISRRRSNKKIFFVIFFAALYLVCYFLATGLGHQRTAAVTLYLAPHLLIIAASLWMLRRVSRGIE